MMKAIINYYFVSLKVYKSNLCSNFLRKSKCPFNYFEQCIYDQVQLVNNHTDFTKSASIIMVKTEKTTKDFHSYLPIFLCPVLQMVYVPCNGPNNTLLW